MESSTGDHRQDKARAVHAPGGREVRRVAPGLSDTKGRRSPAHLTIRMCSGAMAAAICGARRVRIMLGGRSRPGGRLQAADCRPVWPRTPERPGGAAAPVHRDAENPHRASRAHCSPGRRHVAQEASRVRGLVRAPRRWKGPTAWPPPFNDRRRKPGSPGASRARGPSRAGCCGMSCGVPTRRRTVGCSSETAGSRAHPTHGAASRSATRCCPPGRDRAMAPSSPRHSCRGRSRTSTSSGCSR